MFQYEMCDDYSVLFTALIKLYSVGTYIVYKKRKQYQSLLHYYN